MRICVINPAPVWWSSVAFLGQGLAQVKPESHAVRVVALVLAVVGILIWTSGCETGVSPVDQLDRDESNVRTAAAFASVVISEAEPPRLAAVAPIPSSIILRPGESTTFRAVAFDQFGREMDNVTFSWLLAASAVGTITPNGVFHAGINEGSFSGAVVVEVAPQPGLDSEAVQADVDIIILRELAGKVPVSIRLFPENAELEPGRTRQLNAIGMDVDGNFLAGAQPQWEMVESRAGSISPTGRFTAGEPPGPYPQAILVTLPAGREGENITTLMDVLILEALPPAASVTLTILPQTASVLPGQIMDFVGVALDITEGRRLEGIRVRWLTLDRLAGTVFNRGRFQASQRPGVYPDAVEARITLPAQDGHAAETITARATVAIIDTSAKEPPTALLGRISIIPKQVVLSPGESTRLGIVGLNYSERTLSDFEVQWHLDPRLGEIAPSIGVSAGRASAVVRGGGSPGVHPRAIRALVTKETDEGWITREVSADLVIRGPLAAVTVGPSSVAVNSGGRVQFQAQGRDANGILLRDVILRWSLTDEKAGEIDAGGSFVAGQQLGEYPDVVKVVAVQRIYEP